MKIVESAFHRFFFQFRSPPIFNARRTPVLLLSKTKMCNVTALNVNNPPFRHNSYYHTSMSENIIPELTDVCNVVPLENLSISYNDEPVLFGATLSPTHVKHKPKVSWLGNYQKYYTLIMTDPDAPSRADPKFREWLHWLVVNIPGDIIEQGEECFGYVGAGPPLKTSFHRYIFLVYEQKKKIEFLEQKRSSADSRDRPCQKASEIAEKYDLGEPKFINFFLAEYDDYVPELYKTLKD